MADIEDMDESAYSEALDFLARRRRFLPEPPPLLPLFPSPEPSPVLPETSAPLPLLSPLPPSGAGGESEEEREPWSDEEPDPFKFETSSVDLGDSVLEEVSLLEDDPAERDILPEAESDCENGTLVLRLLVSAPLPVSRLELSPRLPCWLLLLEFEVVFTSVELEDAGDKIRRASSLYID